MTSSNIDNQQDALLTNDSTEINHEIEQIKPAEVLNSP